MKTLLATILTFALLFSTSAVGSQYCRRGNWDDRFQTWQKMTYEERVADIKVALNSKPDDYGALSALEQENIRLLESIQRTNPTKAKEVALEISRINVKKAEVTLNEARNFNNPIDVRFNQHAAANQYRLSAERLALTNADIPKMNAHFKKAGEQFEKAGDLDQAVREYVRGGALDDAMRVYGTRRPEIIYEEAVRAIEQAEHYTKVVAQTKNVSYRSQQISLAEFARRLFSKHPNFNSHNLMGPSPQWGEPTGILRRIRNLLE